MAFCRHCGEDVSTGAKFCRSCGATVNNPPVIEDTPASTATTLLPPSASTPIETFEKTPGSLRRSSFPVAAGIGLLTVLLVSGAYFIGKRSQAPHVDSRPTFSEEITTDSEETDSGGAEGTAEQPAEEILNAPAEPIAPVFDKPTPSRSPSANESRWKGEYFPQTRSRYLNESEIINWSFDEVRYALNEIYARRGYPFKTKTIRRQFQKFPWYRPVVGRDQPTTENLMSSIEKANMRLLAKRRNKLQNLSMAHGE